MRIGADMRMESVLTHDSAEGMALKVGDKVRAAVKAVHALLKDWAYGMEPARAAGPGRRVLLDSNIYVTMLPQNLPWNRCIIRARPQPIPDYPRQEAT